MHKIIEEKQLQELKGVNKKLLVHFITQWCGPCKLSKKSIEKQMTTSSSLVIPIEINCDQAEDLVMRYRIEAVPTIILLDKQLRAQQKIIGFLPEKVKELFKKLKIS